MTDETTTAILSRKAFFAFCVLMFIIGIISMWYAFTLNEVMAADASMLKSLIDADTALTGFMGLIVVYILNSNRDAVRKAEENIHNEELNKQKQFRTLNLNFEEIKTLTPMRQRIFQDTKELFDKRISEIQKQIKRVQRGSIDTVITMALALVLLVVSIFASLLAMGNIDPLWRYYSVVLSTTPIPLVLQLLFLAIFFHAKEIFSKANTGTSSRDAKQPTKPKPKQTTP